MEQENKRGLLDFWMSAVTYKQNLLKKDGTVDPLEAQSDALVIYEKFVFVTNLFLILSHKHLHFLSVT